MTTAGGIILEANRLQLHGNWTLAHYAALRSEVGRIAKRGDAAIETIDLSGIDALDTAGASLLAELAGAARLADIDHWAPELPATRRALLTFLVGAVIAFLGATVLRDFGATIYTVNLVAFAFLREFGVLLAAILLAGRTASAFTAQLGSMKANEELDAIRTLGLDPMELLVLPRVLALMLTLPILTFVGMLSGILGGTPASPRLEADRENPPLIQAEPSPLSSLLSSSEELFLQVDTLLTHANRLLFEENAVNLTRIRGNLEIVSRTLVDRRNAIDQGLAGFRQAGVEAEEGLASLTRLGETANRLLDTEGRLATVVDDASRARSDATLTSHLSAFHSRYRESGPEVVIRLNAQLLDEGSREVLASRRIEVVELSRGESIEAVVTAFGRATEAMSRQLVDWTLESLDRP